MRGRTEVPVETHTLAGYEAANWDSDGYFEPATADNELVVRTPNRAGRYQIRVAVRWDNPWGDAAGSPIPLPPISDLLQMFYYTYVEINGQNLGSDGRSTAAAVTGAQGTTQHFAVDKNLSANDTVRVKLWQNFGTTVEAYVYLEIRRLGRKPAPLASITTSSSTESVSETG